MPQRNAAPVYGQAIRPPKKLASYQREIVGARWYRPEAEGGRAYTDMIQKARRIGLSEAAALRAIFFCLGRELDEYGRCGSPDECARLAIGGIVVSKDYASSREVIAKIAANVRELAAAGDVECQAAIPYIASNSIFFPTKGTTVRALAGQGSTIRGWTGFVILDELAFLRNPEEVWRAIKPVADPNWGTAFGYPILGITTPWEEGSLAHRLFTDDSFPFRRRSIDIYEAVDAGFPIVPEDAFRELGIPELVDTEYLCRWGHGGGSYFPMSKLLACKREDGKERASKIKGPKGETLYETIDASGLPENWLRAPCFWGIDVGGGVGRDFTALVQWRIINDEYWIVGVWAFNKLDQEDQVDLAVPLIRRYPGDVRIDANGVGLGFKQALDRRLKDTRITISPVSMDTKNQEIMANRLRRLLDTDRLRIYAGIDSESDDMGYHALILELAKMKAKLGGSGHMQLETPREEEKGHCDRAWAALIGLKAAAGSAILQGGATKMAPMLETTDFDRTGILG